MIRNFFSSLRGRLLLLVFLAVVFGLLLYTAWEQRLAAIQNAKQDALKLARDAVQRQEILVSEARRYLGELAQPPELHSIKTGACSALMASGLKNKNGYTFIGATDLDGNVLCSALPHERPLNVADRSFFQKTIKTRDFSIGNYQIDPVSGKATIDFGYPNFDSRGHFQGILFATLDLSWLDKFLAETNKSSGIILTVIDHNGVILGRATEPETWVGKTMPQHPMIRAILSRKGEGTVEGTGMDSVHRLYAFAPLRISGDAPVYISVGISTEVPYANVLLPGVITALVLLIAWVGSDLFLLRQVKALIGATRRLASGELGARTGLPVSSGELNQLALAFDEMAATLEQQESKRKQAEEVVRQRAQEIQTLHEIGQMIINSVDLQTFLEGILDKALSIGGCDIGVIRLVDPETKMLTPVISRGYRSPENIRPLSVELNETTFGTLHVDVLKNRGAYVEENLPASEGLRTFKKEGVQSTVALPIKAGDEVLGIIQLGSRAPRRFKPEQIRLLESIGNQLGIAVQKSNSHEATERAYKEVQALYTVTATTNQSLDLEQILNEVIRKITEIFKFDMTRIYLIDPSTEENVLHASYENSPDMLVPVDPVRRSDGIGSAVVKSDEPIIFEDIVSDPRYQRMSRTGNLKKSGVRFFAVFPIKSQRKTLGVISFYRRTRRSLTRNEIAVFTAVAQQIGIAAENASLFGQTAAKAQELSALYSIAGIASQFLDINVLLGKALNKVLEVFAVDAAGIYLRDSREKELRLAAYQGFSNGVALPHSYPTGEEFLGEVVEKGEILIFDDRQNNPKYAEVANAGFQASLFIPIKVRGENLGVMNFLNKEPRRFSESEIQLIKSVAYHLGVAVGNATLFSQVKQKTVELEKANKGKDEFLSVTSHELRTPLNVITGYTTMMKNGFFGEIKPEQDAALEKVIRQSQYLLNMVDEILRVTSIEAGKLKPESKEFDLGVFLDELRSSYEITLGKEPTLHWHSPKSLPAVVTDGDKLRHVLQNLINNAIKFTERGAVTFSAKLISGFSALECKVADTGCGIPKEMLPSIFDKFRQVDSSERRAYGGLGLGLYIAKKYTECLGGTIEVESELGKGSTFTVKIPLENHPDRSGEWLDGAAL